MGINYIILEKCIAENRTFNKCYEYDSKYKFILILKSIFLYSQVRLF